MDIRQLSYSEKTITTDASGDADFTFDFVLRDRIMVRLDIIDDGLADGASLTLKESSGQTILYLDKIPSERSIFPIRHEAVDHNGQSTNTFERYMGKNRPIIEIASGGSANTIRVILVTADL